MRVIGVLNSGAPETLGETVAAFHRGLGEAGYVDGQNVTIQYRWGHDDYKRANYKRLEALAAELAKLPVAVLVAAGGPVSALAAKAAAKNTPIVFTSVTDPVKSGLVKSLDRPGGKLTGTAGLTTELDATRLELLREFNPKARLSRRASQSEPSGCGRSDKGLASQGGSHEAAACRRESGG